MSVILAELGLVVTAGLRRDERLLVLVVEATLVMLVGALTLATEVARRLMTRVHLLSSHTLVHHATATGLSHVATRVIVTAATATRLVVHAASLARWVLLLTAMRLPLRHEA